MLDTPTVLIVLLVAGVAYLINYLAHTNRTGRPLPPGPKGLPILGNVNDLPKPGTLECHHWAQHKDLYGPISSITVLGQTFIIINDPQLALELLRDRQQAHAARPHMVFSSDMYVA
jgi:cytochrome P450